MTAASTSVKDKYCVEFLDKLTDNFPFKQFRPLFVMILHQNPTLYKNKPPKTVTQLIQMSLNVPKCMI